MKTKKIFIIAGEKSGDLLGSKFMQSLKKQTQKKYKLKFYGIGGELMQKEGIKSIFPMEELSLMGVFEILPKIFKILARIKQTTQKILKIKPDLVLTIDAPEFSFRVMEKVRKSDKENKIKKAHLIAPSVWAHREKRAKYIAEIYDLLLCVLPFEPPYFEKYNLKSVFIGHPLFDKRNKKNSNKKEKILSEFCLKKNDLIISVTPGSRLNEVKKLFPIIKQSISQLKEKERHKNIRVFLFATKKTNDLLQDFLRKNNFEACIVEDEKQKQKIMSVSTIALAKSGTNTFEFNIHKVPMVVIYKFNWLTTKLTRILIKIKFANLINIIKNKEVIPECILEKCKTKLITQKLEFLLKNKKEREKQIKTAQEVIKQLGYESRSSSADKGVKEILKLIK